VGRKNRNSKNQKASAGRQKTLGADAVTPGRASVRATGLQPLQPAQPPQPAQPLQPAQPPQSVRVSCPPEEVSQPVADPHPSGRAGRARRLQRTACYVDFENLFYNVAETGRNFSVARAVRDLNHLSRQICGEGYVHTAVYANWDSISARSRHAQDDWAQVGWRTVAVPTREDQVSKRLVKNMVDFVMSLDILEDARDRDFDCFVVVSGDADFCEVVERLKRLHRKVVVVSLRPPLSYRLGQAADRCVTWELEDVSGKDTFPIRTAERPPRTSPGRHRHPGATELDLLRTALSEAREITGLAVVDWETVRDDFYVPLARCGPEEADSLVRGLAQAGFVVLEPRRVRDGTVRNFLKIPV